MSAAKTLLARADEYVSTCGESESIESIFDDAQIYFNDGVISTKTYLSVVEKLSPFMESGEY